MMSVNVQNNLNKKQKLTCTNFTKRELLELFGVSELPNASNMVLISVAFCMFLHKNCINLLVATDLPDPDSPVITMHCGFLNFFNAFIASLPKYIYPSGKRL